MGNKMPKEIWAYPWKKENSYGVQGAWYWHVYANMSALMTRWMQSSTPYRMR